MSGRVLIVSPHFPPVNAADHQRIRMSLPYLEEFGWEPTILAIRPECLEGMPIDSLLEQTVPRETKVARVGALSARLTRAVGLGNLAMRALPYLWREGSRLLVNGSRGGRPFDLVFFSTTQFPVMILGPIWKRKCGVPYVVDFQDPWLDDYYERTGTAPPGGKAKHGLSRRLAGKLEPRVVRDVSQVISVSPAYVNTLRIRYPHLRTEQFTVLPFGAPEKDFEMLQSLEVQQHLFDPGDGRQHWLYVGRAGHDMASALRLLFSSIQAERTRHPEEWATVRLHFVGTSYAPEGRARKTVEPVAVACGVADIVKEQTARIPYFETLRALTEADALLVIGSDSASYSASKLYPYILARKPMLSVLHKDSPAVEILQRCRAGGIVAFDTERPEGSKGQMLEALENLRCQVSGVRLQPQGGVDWSEFQQYSAREMTLRMCMVFDKAVGMVPAPSQARA